MKYSTNPSIICRMAEIISRLNPVELVTPTNVTEEKERWIRLAKEGYYANPFFSYDHTMLKEIASYGFELKAGEEHLYVNLEPETPAEKAIHDILINRIESAIICTEIAASILLGDDETTSRLSNKLYGWPSNSQAIKAYGIVEKKIEPEKAKSRFTKKEQDALKAMKFNANEIRFWFEEVINLYGIEGWTVEIGDQYTAIDVRDKNSTGKPLVGIPTDRTVDGLKLLELIGHEIDSHLRGSANCKALVAEILGSDSPLAPLFDIIAKSDNELFYEGVAKISDVSVNGSSGLPLPYATIACDQARRGGDFSIVGEIIKGIRIDMGQAESAAINGAWSTTYRVMRGSTTPEIGGYCFVKDYIYMAGYDIVKHIVPEWYNFASMTIDEVSTLTKVMDLSQPKYDKIDAVGFVKNKLLSSNAK